MIEGIKRRVPLRWDLSLATGSFGREPPVPLAEAERTLEIGFAGDGIGLVVAGGGQGAQELAICGRLGEALQDTLRGVAAIGVVG